MFHFHFIVCLSHSFSLSSLFSLSFLPFLNIHRHHLVILMSFFILSAACSYLCLSIYMYFCLFDCLSFFLSACLPFSLSVCLSFFCLSVALILSLFLYVFFSFFSSHSQNALPTFRYLNVSPYISSAQQFSPLSLILRHFLYYLSLSLSLSLSL